MTSHHRASPRLWPGSALPLPTLRVWRHRLVADDDGWIDTTGWIDTDFVETPAEIHLRQFADVRPSQPADLLDLIEATGLPLDEVAPWRGVTNPAMNDRLAKGFYTQRVATVAKQLKLPDPRLANDERAVGEGFVHLAEVAERVGRVQLLVEHVDAVTAGRSSAPVWQRRGFFDPDEWEHVDPFSDVLANAPADTLAWHHFADMLNHGLVGVSARVLPPEIDGYPSIDGIHPSYTAACVGIYNDLVADLPYRRCADETCGRLFKVQLGRAERGSPRTVGVQYCTAAHARNQTQRDRRRRAAKTAATTEKEGSD